MHETFTTPGSLLLEVRLASGHVEIATGDSTTTSVDVEAEHQRPGRDALEGVTVELRDRRGGGQELVVDCGGWRGFGRGASYRVRIQAPHGADLDLAAASADLAAHGRLGAVRVDSASGDVDVERADGAVDVKTASGGVRIAQAASDVRSRTASGDTELGRVDGQIEVITASGGLRVAEAGGDVRAKLASGDVVLGQVERGKVDVRTVSGDVQVGVRPGSDVLLDVVTKSGTASSELAPSAGASGDAPFVELRVRSVSGDVRIGRTPAIDVAIAAGRVSPF